MEQIFGSYSLLEINYIYIIQHLRSNSMKIKRLAIIALSISILTPTFSFSGTPLKLGTQGKKTITLTNKVGENFIKFLSEAPLEEIKGTTDGISGTFIIDLDNLEATSGQISVEVKTMKTGLDRRDSHLKSKDWLHEDKFPTIVFEIKGLTDIQIIKQENGNGEIKAIAKGDFIMHGESKQISSPITLKYIRESEATKKRAPGDFSFVQASFSIALKDFNIKGVRGLIGSKVGETIQIDANFYGSTAK